MTSPVVVSLAVLLPLAIAATFLLTRHAYRRRSGSREELSEVSQQHIELFQGGQLSELAVESTKAYFRDLLERGEVAKVEASLRPGTHYVVQVRALAELGTEDAGLILERQLGRRLSDDEIEQSWYWIDLASGLRALNRPQSLPHLLRCAAAGNDLPLSHFFAAETVCFLGFSGYLGQPETPLGRAALRVLHRALEGLRHGLPPYVVSEGRLGEVIEALWDERPGRAEPLTVRVFHEALRLLRRAGHGEQALAGEAADVEAFRWQMARLAALEAALEDYLGEAGEQLLEALDLPCDAEEERDILLAFADLRADAGAALMEMLGDGTAKNPELAIAVLTWCPGADIGPFLRGRIEQRISQRKRATRRRRAYPPKRPSLPPDVPYAALLSALRGHPSPETEAVLLAATCDWDPLYRIAAYSSLGWWEPVRRAEVLVHLQAGRRDPSAEARYAARTALARLGERQALQGFRQALFSEDNARVHETIQAVAAEGLTLLWPDLDRLADSEDADIAHHAREALTRLGEEMDRSRRR